MNKIFKLLLCGAIIIITAGCAAPNVKLSPAFWQNHTQKVVVANDKRPKAALYETGRQGVADMIVTGLVTHQFEAYLQHYPTQSLGQIKRLFVQALRARHINAQTYKQPIIINHLKNHSGDNTKFAKKNYTPLVAKIGPHKLLVVSVLRVGAIRPYYGFIPLGRPQALCSLQGRLVNLINNRILWRRTVSVTLSVAGKWDQPPYYSAFSSTLQIAIKTAEKQLLNNFLTNQ